MDQEALFEFKERWTNQIRRFPRLNWEVTSVKRCVEKALFVPENCADVNLEHKRQSSAE